MMYEMAGEYEQPFQGVELYDYEYEFRGNGEPCNLLVGDWSKHYECERVAKVLDCGAAVSWIYWFGGGKHGEPEAIKWMCENEAKGAYEVEFTQEQKTITVTTYSKK